MGERRWGFEEADDWDDVPRKEAPKPEEDQLVGRDTDEVVEVVVSPEAEVQTVRLTPDWQRSVDRRALGASVVSAANAATMLALARKVEQTDLTAPVPPAVPERPVIADDSPLATQDVNRLLAQVSAELASFTERLSTVADRPVDARSAGGHVHGTARHGQVLTVELDPAWAGRVPHNEIEGELLQVLRTLHDSSTPDYLATGPTGRAIAELQDLASDPRRLVRRLGLPDPGDPTDGTNSW